MRRLAVLLALASVTGACGLTGPQLECGDIGRDPCEQAVEIARADVDTRVGPASWFEDPGPERITVEPGCGADITCPPSLVGLIVTVTFHSSVEGEEPIRAAVRRSDIGMPSESP